MSATLSKDKTQVRRQNEARLASLYEEYYDRIARYVGDFIAAQIEKAYVEMGGKPWTPKEAAADEHWKRADQHERGPQPEFPPLRNAAQRSR